MKDIGMTRIHYLQLNAGQMLIIFMVSLQNVDSNV